MTEEDVQNALEQVGLPGGSVSWENSKDFFLVSFLGDSQQAVTFIQLTQLGRLLSTDSISVKHKPEERWSEDTVEGSYLQLCIWEAT